MKQKYIDSLLSEIQQLESRVANLKENQKVSFSFFKESFKRTQEITRLLHELEFVQIEDMKEQMEKLVQFLSESESSKDESKVEPPVNTVVVDSDIDMVSSDIDQRIKPVFVPKIQKITSKEVEEKIEENQSSLDEHQKENNSTRPHEAAVPTQEIAQHLHPPVLTHQKETIVDHLSPKNKSLNDIQPASHTVLDTKRSISLNDRFLFQRELFDNNRGAMSVMLTKLQSFSTFDATESYLKENTDWNFKDETVDKFMQMLKESFR